MTTLLLRLHAWFIARGDRGQATTEYALVLLGAALVALVFVEGWVNEDAFIIFRTAHSVWM